MTFIYNLIFSGIKNVIDTMKEFEISDGVNLFYFLIALTVMTIVVTYLVNVARSPGVRSISSERASARASEAHQRALEAHGKRMQNYDASIEHHETATNYYASKHFYGK